MCAWRTMLLRSSTHPDPSADNTHPLHTASNPSLNTLSSYTSTTSTTATTSSALGLLAPSHSAAQASAQAGVAAKPTVPTKRPVPFQNLGLHSGAASGNLGLVKFALDNGQPIDSVINGVFAIHAACCSNANVAVVQYLLDRGADVNARRLPRKYSSEKGVQTVGTTGSTPLHFAAANGCLAVVDILLRHGAIVDMVDKYGSSPLSVAAARNHPEVTSLLRQFSSMQRGDQDLTPDNENKDPFADRKGSSEFGHRGVGVITPSTRSTAGHTKDTSSQSLPLPTGRATQTTRSPGQRRISLPSIIESPSSPNIPPPPPRQSCDFARTPQSTEPLVRTTASIRSMPSQPTRNVTLQLSKPENRAPRSPPARDQSNPVPEITKEGPTTRMMRRSHTTQGAQGDRLTAPQATSTMKRRKSMESAGLLSPQSALSILRRKSFEQLSSLRGSDSKSRRSSDASSTASQGTSSSRTSGTSQTSVSDHGTESVQEHVGGDESSSGKGKGKSQMLAVPKPSDSGNPPPLIRSTSQPVLEFAKSKRPPLSFALDVTARQSLDLQRLASNQDRNADKDRTLEPRNDSDSDLPGMLFRRRTMQEIANPKIGANIPRYHSVGPMMESMNTSSFSGDSPGRSQNLNHHHLHLHHSSATGSSTSLQEISAPRHSTGSMPSGLSGSTSFSGSATVSGRFSRVWSASNAAGTEGLKDGSAGNWNASEFGEASGEAAAQALARAEHGRSRGGMLNRLSGIWSRR